MKVAIDARSVGPILDGVGRHVVNLLLGLSCRGSDLEFLVLYHSPLVRKLVERSGGSFRGRFQWIRTWSDGTPSLANKLELPWILKINRADLFHDIGTTGVWTGGVPSIVTVHELADAKKQMKRIFTNARLIIAVSQSVADEIEEKFDISRPKIRVISNAVDPWYQERVNEKEIRAMRERLKLFGRYFLCVTSNKASKNVGLVESLMKDWSGAEEWVFTVPHENAQKGRYLGNIEDVWLRPLYAACTALIVPSLYEGFSLPPIEVLSMGNIPVVSDIPAHREVLKDILPEELFFDPKSKDSLSRALQRVLEGGEPLRTSICDKFRLVRDRYSFLQTAEQVQAAYRG